LGVAAAHLGWVARIAARSAVLRFRRSASPQTLAAEVAEFARAPHRSRRG
jgi:hypothetical protein